MQLDNFFTIFVLILIISANYIGTTFPCRFQHLLNNNNVIKHLFGYLTMTFFVILADPISQDSIKSNLLKAFYLYIWFVLLTKTNIYFFVSLLLILAISYLLIIYRKEQIEENADKEWINKLDWINDMLNYIFVIGSIIGVLIYLGEKKLEYKSKFSYYRFFIGNYSCKNYTPSYSLSKSLKHSFD